jgi:predicted Kef-type K+ transport protein
MPHDVGLTAMLAVGFALASSLASLPTGWACRPWSAISWRRPGRPFTPGFVDSRASTGQLAELASFSCLVSDRTSADDLIAVRGIAIPSASRRSSPRRLAPAWPVGGLAPGGRRHWASASVASTRRASSGLLV